jgi:hypothetical protein
MQVGYRSLVHSEVVIITEIQEFFPSELSAIVGDDGVRNCNTHFLHNKIYRQARSALDCIFEIFCLRKGFAQINLA